MKVTAIIQEVYEIDEGEYRVLIDVEELKSNLLCSVFLGTFEEGLSLIGKKIMGDLFINYGYTFIDNFDDKTIYFENNISKEAADRGQDSHCRLSGFVVSFASSEAYKTIIRVQSVYTVDIVIDLVYKDRLESFEAPINELLKIGDFIKADGYLEFEINFEQRACPLSR